MLMTVIYLSWRENKPLLKNLIIVNQAKEKTKLRSLWNYLYTYNIEKQENGDSQRDTCSKMKK